MDAPCARISPRLDPNVRPGPPSPRHALLLNPFYPKDPHASFGKHVLTPSLALTSIAASHARRIGRSPTGTRTCCKARRRGEPFPQVVGITVHLTFADRAYELARWYRERGATVIFGGLHVLSCPDEVPAARRRPGRSARACSSGREILRRRRGRTVCKPIYHGSYREALPRRPAARAATSCPAASS